MNDTLDWQRIRHLLKIGILASLMVLTGDMLLGWGVSDPSVTNLPAVFTRYLSVSDGRIIVSALLGLIGIPIECLCWFAIYRMMKPFSEKDAHATAIQEMLCFIGWFLLPVTVIFLVFFLLAAVVQIRAFSKGHTPLPRRCWVFSVLFGFVFAVVMRLIGNYGLTNALATGWISIGNLWMMSGLLSASRKVGK